MLLRSTPHISAIPPRAMIPIPACFCFLFTTLIDLRLFGATVELDWLLFSGLVLMYK